MDGFETVRLGISVLEAGLGILEGFSVVLLGFVDGGKIVVRKIPVLFEFTSTIDEFDGLVGVTKIVEEGTDLKIDSGIGLIDRGCLKSMGNGHVG